MIKLLDPADEVFDFKEIFTGELKSIFKPAGYLQSALELEHRPEQEKMARRVGQLWLLRSHYFLKPVRGWVKAWLICSLHSLQQTKQEKGGHCDQYDQFAGAINWKRYPHDPRFIHKVDSLKKYQDFRCALLVGRAIIYVPTVCPEP